jgi:hypothetical protein
MSTPASEDDRTQTTALWSCTCYLCTKDALWEISVEGENDRAELTFACEIHARGHAHLAIVLPERMSPRAPYIGGR